MPAKRAEPGTTKCSIALPAASANDTQINWNVCNVQEGHGVPCPSSYLTLLDAHSKTVQPNTQRSWPDHIRSGGLSHAKR